MICDHGHCHNLFSILVRYRAARRDQIVIGLTPRRMNRFRFATLQPASRKLTRLGDLEPSLRHGTLSSIMRMNIKARAVASSRSNLSEDRITLTLRPAVSLPGDYSFITNVDSLRRLLRRTELSSTVLDRFETGLRNPKGASLSAVEISEKTLTQIGYFVD